MRVKKSLMFLWILIVLTAGIFVSGKTLQSSPAATTAAVLSVLAALGIMFKTQKTLCLILLLTFVSGFFLLRLDLAAYSKNPLNYLKPFNLQARAVICKNPVIRTNTESKKLLPTTNIILQLKILHSPKTPFAEGQKINTTISGWHPVFFQAGDVILINTVVKSVKPSFFAYKKNTTPLTAHINSGNSICVSSDHSAASLPYRVRRFFSTFVKTALTIPNKPQRASSGVLTAALTGNRSYVPENITSNMKTTNTLHLLAISGMHLWIIYLLIAGCAKLLRLNSISGSVFCLTLLNVYAWLTGYPPSVTRATLMISLYLVAKSAGREPRAINCLGIAGVLILLLNPSSLFSLGFELSFFITALILTINPMSFASKPTPVVYGIGKIFSIALVAWAGSEIILIHAFGQVGFAGLILNPLAAVFFSVVITASLASSVIMVILPANLYLYITKANCWLVDNFLELTEKMSEVKYLSFTLQGPPQNLTVLALAAALVITALLEQKHTAKQQQLQRLDP